MTLSLCLFSHIASIIVINSIFVCVCISLFRKLPKTKERILLAQHANTWHNGIRITYLLHDTNCGVLLLPMPEKINVKANWSRRRKKNKTENNHKMPKWKYKAHSVLIVRWCEKFAINRQNLISIFLSLCVRLAIFIGNQNAHHTSHISVIFLSSYFFLSISKYIFLSII